MLLLNSCKEVGESGLVGSRLTGFGFSLSKASEWTGIGAGLTALIGGRGLFFARFPCSVGLTLSEVLGLDMLKLCLSEWH